MSDTHSCENCGAELSTQGNTGHACLRIGGRPAPVNTENEYLRRIVHRINTEFGDSLIDVIDGGRKTRTTLREYLTLPVACEKYTDLYEHSLEMGRQRDIAVRALTQLRDSRALPESLAEIVNHALFDVYGFAKVYGSWEEYRERNGNEE